VAIFTEGLIVPADGAQPVSFITISFWLLLPLAALFAGVFGALLGAPTLRLRGDYLAIVTLGFGEIVPIVYQNVPWFFGQLGMTPSGPADIPTPVGTISFSSKLDNMWFYWLVLAVLALIVVAVASLRDSSLGRAWVAIREDETAAAASGVNLVRTKLLAFGLGATVGGIGGALYAGFTPSIAPPDFNFGISITILIMIVLGGIGSIPGVILGAAILKFIDVYLLGQVDHAVHGSSLVAPDGALLHFLAGVDFNQAKLLIYGIVLVLMILLRPQGLIPDVRRRLELKGEGASEEGTSAVGLLELEEAGESETEPGTESGTVYSGAGSDAWPREGEGDTA
jgi:branched-chain amino acid transport system permease protein